jgi:hypothetical protein
MYYIGLVLIILFFVSSNQILSAKSGEDHGIDFAKTVLGYSNWENLRDWNKTLSAKDPLLYTIQIQDILTCAAAIAIDYSGTEGSLSNDFFYLERYFQMKQFSKNKVEIPSIDDFPSIGFGIMHRYYCHSGYKIDKSTAESSLKERLLEAEKKVKFGFSKEKSLIPYSIRKKRILSAPGRWKTGRESVLIPSVANAFDLNLKRGGQESLAQFISTVIYYTHLLGDYMVGAQEPLPEYGETIKLFKKDLRRIRILSFKSRLKIRAFFMLCPMHDSPGENAKKTIDKMGNIFPRIIRTELRKRKRKTYHKLKANRKEALKEKGEKHKTTDINKKHIS